MGNKKKKPSIINQGTTVKPVEKANWATFHRGGLYCALGALFLMGAVLGYRQIASPDLGFHLSSAEWILQNRAIPATDIFTYTVPDNIYIDLQWTFQLVVYGLEKLAGTAGIIALTTLLTLAFGATLLWRVHRLQGRIPLTAVFMLGLFFLGTLWEIRPHLFSWIYGSFILLVLEEYNRGNRRWLPLLPVLMLLWVNAHSLYILGLVSIGTYVFGDVVRGFWIHRRLVFDKRLLMWAVAAVLVCLINPYHIKGLQFPIGQFFLIQGESGYKSTLTGTAEFLSPFRLEDYVKEGRFVLLKPLLWWHLFTLLAITGIFSACKKVQLAEWILFAGFLYIFHSANKNFGFFVMVCFPVVVAGLDRISRRIQNACARTAATPVTIVFSYGASALIFLLLAVAAGSNWLYHIGWQEATTGAGFNTVELPVQACQFINDHGIEGRIINCWNDGGYIGWATNRKVFINSEGNTIGLAFYGEYIKAREPQGFPEALEKWKPTVAVVRYRITPFWLYHLTVATNAWRMVYADDHVAVFLHDSVAPHIPALPEPVSGKDYQQYSLQETARIIQQISDAGGPGFMQWIQGSAAYPLTEMQKSAYYLHTSEVDACIATCVSGLQQAGFLVPELMLNLGHALNAQKHYTLADRCYNAFLSTDDDPVMAQEILRQRRSRR